MVSLRKHIDKHCKSCIYDPLSGHGTWRQQVEGCTVLNCELYAVRPCSRGKNASSTNEMPEGLRKYQESQITKGSN